MYHYCYVVVVVLGFFCMRVVGWLGGDSMEVVLLLLLLPSRGGGLGRCGGCGGGGSGDIDDALCGCEGG